jgi:amino acid adenylation domain-containing protein
VHELFEEQVLKTPEAIAVVYEGEPLTYGQLNGRANQLARYLRDQGVGPDQLVGLCVERGVEMVVGLLGILKAGGAYVPLDPNYPQERLAYLLQDASPRVLLTQERLRDRLMHSGMQAITLDSQWPQIATQSDTNLPAQALGLSSENLAYVIYTSGSTGKPKGAMNEHGGVVNRLHWMQERYALGPEDRVLQKTPFSFDVSVWEFFWPLLNGARLIVARPQGHQDGLYLRDLIEEAEVTRLHFVPSMLRSFLDQYEPGRCASVRQIVCSGEELSGELERQCLQSLPQARLSNLYGPTEAAIDVTAWECGQHGPGSRVPIGRPISNTQIYILDEGQQPVPIGVTGEVYIGGVGVGRGYWKRPQLTAERFIRDPFRTAADARMYRTGDLGRWRADGNIEYLGRNDSQVKLRGFRIELGEIESQLTRHARVREAVVLARQGAPGVAAEKRLVAYVTVREPSGSPELGVLSVEELRSHLLGVLPEYMVPSAFVVLESLPLTPNGKLDRRALPAPDQEAYVRREYEAPQGETEVALAGIWQELLGVERVGRQDNFFELGGHSLLVTQLIARIREIFLLDIPLVTVFTAPSISALGEAIFSIQLSQFEPEDIARVAAEIDYVSEAEIHEPAKDIDV